MVFSKWSFRLWNAPTLGTIGAADKTHRFIPEKQENPQIQNPRSLAGASTPFIRQDFVLDIVGIRRSLVIGYGTFVLFALCSVSLMFLLSSQQLLSTCESSQ